jgi:hypothetical protein
MPRACWFGRMANRTGKCLHFVRLPLIMRLFKTPSGLAAWGCCRFPTSPWWQLLYRQRCWLRTGFNCAVRFFLVNVSLFVVTSAAFAGLQVSLGSDGNTIHATMSAYATCVSASIDSPITSASFCGPGPGNRSDTDQQSCNSVGPHEVYGCYSTGAGTYACEKQTVNVTTAAVLSGTCTNFGMSPRQYSAQAAPYKVLTHKYGTEPFPTSEQKRDAELSIYISSSRLGPGVNLHWRVIDLPRFPTLGGETAYIGDNRDQSPNAGTINGVKFGQLQTPPLGTTTILPLKTTDVAAGDNYEVQVSTDSRINSDPTFTCVLPDCLTTGTIEVWKRVYIEQDRMFRRGTMFSGNVSTGTLLPVVSNAMFTKKTNRTPGTKVMLLHAAGNPGGAHFEGPFEVVGVSTKGAPTITIDKTIQKPYYTNSATHLADGIGVLSPEMVNDFYSPNFDLAQSTVAKSFVEYFLYIPPQGEYWGIPFYADFPEAGTVEHEAFANHWFNNASKPNMFHSIGASERSTFTIKDNTELGFRLPPTRTFFVFVGRVDAQSSWANKTLLNAEATTHEFIHGFDVNTNPVINPVQPGHCTTHVALDDSSKKCLMRDGNTWFDNGAGLLPEFYDGKTSLHNDASGSEYREISQHSEPM